MPLVTISPQHSFVNFEHKLDSFVMPAYGSAAAAFQVTLDASNEIPLDDVITAGVCDEHGNILYESADIVENVCAMARIKGVNFDGGFPVVIPAGQPIPAGVYDTPEDFFAALRSAGYGAFDKDFMHCCNFDTDVHFSFNTGIVPGAIKFYKGLLQITIPADETMFGPDIDIEIGKCFYYFIKHSKGTVFSNNFKRLPDSKFLTWCTYSSNEDAYSFLFKKDTMFNQIWLPLFSGKPAYPGTRKVYLMSNKQYKVQSASVEKEYQCKTDRLPEMIHDRIVVMLEMDNVRFENRKMSSAVFKKDDYSIDWSDDEFADIESAIAKFKVQTPFEGRNSNCEKRRVCVPPAACIPVTTNNNALPDGTVGQFYGPAITLFGDGPFTSLIVGAPGWLAAQVLSDQLIITGVPDTPGPSRIHIRVTNCSGANTLEIDHTITLAMPLTPALIQTSNTGGTTRVQAFTVGPNVSAGNRYELMVYSHPVTVVAVAGDTATTIAGKLAAAINATTPTQWNDHGSAPVSGTAGFPPTATGSGAVVTITLNNGNQFAGNAYEF